MLSMVGGTMYSRSRNAVIAGSFMRRNTACMRAGYRFGRGGAKGLRNLRAALDDYPLPICDDTLEDDELWMVGFGED